MAEKIVKYNVQKEPVDLDTPPRSSAAERLGPVVFAEAMRLAPRLTVGALAVTGTIINKISPR